MTTKWTILSLVLLGAAVASRGDDVKDPKPVSADALFAEAKALSSHEKWEEAIARFRDFVGKHPDDPRASEARFWIGFSLVKSDEFTEAIRELEPFEGNLAKDKWADDALLQLGHAYRGEDDKDRALTAWKQLLEKHPDSVWKNEAAIQIIDLLFHESRDYAACLPYCEQVTRDATDFAGIAEARYAGAYCLIALGRYEEADRWMDRLFNREDGTEAGWRRVLNALRELRMKQADRAFALLGSLETDFPDLSREDRLDITLRAATILARESQKARAADLLLAALKQSAGDSEDEIAELVNQLAETVGDDDEFRVTLERLATDPALPLMARLAVRDRYVDALREDDRPDQAAALLRDALAKEKSEYARCRTATLLAEVLKDDLEDQTEAAKVLDDVVHDLRRDDLVHQVREAIKDLEREPKDEGE